MFDFCLFIYLFDRYFPDISSGQEMTSVQQKNLLRVSLFSNVIIRIIRNKIFFLKSYLINFKINIYLNNNYMIYFA